VRRYLRIVRVQLHASIAQSMQYRVNFLVQGGMAIFWILASLIPLWVLYGQRQQVAGWNFEGALVVMGWFTMLRGVLEGAINPSLVEVVDRIRTGSFDYTLLKPADAQLLVSTTRFEPLRVIDVLAGLGLVVYGVAARADVPSVLDVLVAAALLACAVAILYSVWIVMVSASFWVVRIDNLSYLFSAIFDAGRWPIQVFRGFWRIAFTFLIPLALMTTYPAMALLGTLEVEVAIGCGAGAVITATLARRIWMASIRSYTSASS